MESLIVMNYDVADILILSLCYIAWVSDVWIKFLNHLKSFFP